MAKRIPESLYRLPGKRAAAGVGDRARYHQRNAVAELFERVLDGEQRSLGV